MSIYLTIIKKNQNFRKIEVQIPHFASLAPSGVWKLLIRWAVAVPLGYVNLKSMIIICKKEHSNPFKSISGTHELLVNIFILLNADEASYFEFTAEI